MGRARLQNTVRRPVRETQAWGGWADGGRMGRFFGRIPRRRCEEAVMDGRQVSQRQLAFRADFRGRIAAAYSGWAHVALIYAIGGAAIWYCARQSVAPAWYEWLVIPVAFALSNVFEWWIHRTVMHRPVKGFMGIYKRHTLAHHQFFTDAEPSFDTSRD